MCAVFGCNAHNRKKNGKFFRFPKCPKLQRKWLQFCKRADKINLLNARICSKHFSDEDFIFLKGKPQIFENIRALKKEVVPTLANPLSSASSAGRLLLILNYYAPCNRVCQLKPTSWLGFEKVKTRLALVGLQF